MRRISLSALALTLAVGALPLSAQPRRGPANAGLPPRAPDAAPLRAAGTPADLLLRARAQLVLTDEQVARLETLATAQRRALTPAPGQQLRLRADLLDAMAGEGNPQAARTALDKLSAAQNERIVAQLRARQEARAVLTEAQRSRVDALRGSLMQARGLRAGNGRAGQPGAMRPGQRGQRPAGVMPGRGARGATPMAPRRGPGRRPMDDGLIND